jgi:hypothetical protein
MIVLISTIVIVGLTIFAAEWLYKKGYELDDPLSTILKGAFKAALDDIKEEKKKTARANYEPINNRRKNYAIKKEKNRTSNS